MVELVDTTDLKSVGPNGPCGFKSRSGYKFSPVLAGLLAHLDWSVCHASWHIVFNTAACPLSFSCPANCGSTAVSLSKPSPALQNTTAVSHEVWQFYGSVAGTRSKWA